MSERSGAQAAGEACVFLSRFRSLVLSTADSAGQPHASYAPFVRMHDNAFYIYVSDLASHSANLRGSSCASVLLIEDEGGVKEVFARRRLTFHCAVDMLERTAARWGEVLDRFEAKFGAVIGLIRPLEDFNLFRLRPQSATYVRGFAQAYPISGPALESFKHVNDLGLSGDDGPGGPS